MRGCFMEYKWGLKDLLETKRQLINLTKTVNDPISKHDILYLLSAIDDNINEEKGKKERVKCLGRKEKLKIIENDLSEFPYYYSLVSKFYDTISKQFDKINTLEDLMIEKIGLNQSYSKITGAKISNDGALHLTQKFYREHMPSLYPIFNKFYADRFNSVRFLKKIEKDTAANTTYIWPLERYFMNCINDCDISKVFSLIHEYGHVIYFLSLIHI